MTKFYLRYRGRAYAELKKFYDFFIGQDMMTKKSKIKAKIDDFFIKFFSSAKIVRYFKNNVRQK